jgi:mRNA-degrading endonuclease toxin of MazEF toxin-antitoxin module
MPVCRGDVFIVAIHESEIVGAEQAKTRRYVVVSSNRLNFSDKVVIGVPLSLSAAERGKTNAHRILVPQSEIKEDTGTQGCKESVALTEQVRVLAVERLGVPPIRVATLSPAIMAKIEVGLAYILDIP